MRRIPFVSGLAASLVFAAQALAQPLPPSIRSAVLAPATGVLTITGEHLGADVQVMVDGQLVTSLPGATDTQLEVQAPTTVLTTPGTYRLVVFDPVRKGWDGFVVVSAPALAVSLPPPSGAAVAAGAASAVPLTPAVTPGEPAPGSATLTPSPLMVIEDTGGPWRTALGFQALLGNTTGLQNTAVGYQAALFGTTGGANTSVGYHASMGNVTGAFNTALGYEALRDNTSNLNTAVGGNAMTLATGSSNTAVGFQALHEATGSFNVAIGHRAGLAALNGSSNIFVGSDVQGTNADSNVIRLGRPFTGTAGQNKAFIAGIRGTTVSGGEGVYIDANGQLGSGPVVPGADTVGSAQVIADSLTAADLAPSSVTTSEIADGAVTPAKLSASYAALNGTNFFAGDQVIDNGSLHLISSASGQGMITRLGMPFLHDSGFNNVFVGSGAGRVGTTSDSNAAMGLMALQLLLTGSGNTSLGAQSLAAMTAASGNIAIGQQAMFNATAGDDNTVVGRRAGATLDTGSSNVYLGADVVGATTESNTMRLGLPYDAATGAGQRKTYIAGVYPTILNGPARPVFIDANGQIGTMGPPAVVAGPGVPSPAPQPSSAELEAQRQLIAAQAAVIADLQARLARVEALVTAPRDRRARP